MKKALICAAITSIAAATVTAIEWGNLDNIAQGAVVTVSSNSGAANTITDGNNGTSWQAIPSTHNVTTDWALIDLGESKEFNTLEIAWEASHPAKYTVYVSEEDIPYEINEANVNTEENPLMLECGFINAQWLETATPFAVREIEGEANYTDVISQKGKGRYVLIYTNEYNGNGRNYGCRIFDVRMANIMGTDKVDNLHVSESSVIEGGTTDITVTAHNILGEVMDITGVTDLTLACSNPAAVEISGGAGGVFTVKGLKQGSYTLTATATTDGKTVSGTANFTVEYNWANVEKVNLKGKTIYGHWTPNIDNGHPLANAIDGNEDTYYEFNGGWSNSWIMVDLGTEYLIDAIGVAYADQSNGSVKIGYTLEWEPFETFPNNSEWTWGADAVPGGWTHSGEIKRSSNSTVTKSFDQPVKARYICVRDADNPGGNPQVKEIYVKGEALQAQVATRLEVKAEPAGLFAGETATVSYAVYDQYNGVMNLDETAEITVEGAAYADGTITATEKGRVKISAKLGNLTAETAIMVASQDDYCMGAATITSDTSKSDAKFATDGGSDPANQGGLFVITEGESQGEHEHWILADLHKNYNLDMIIAIWEGACPADYDVYVGATEDSLIKLYSVTGHNQATWYDRFSGKEMTDVRYIKIVTTRNATGYGIKLYDLKAYGTSNVVSVASAVTLKALGDNIATDETVELEASVLDQFGGNMPELSATFSCTSGNVTFEGNQFQASAPGSYDVTAAYGDIVSEPVTINVVAASEKKVTPPHTATLNGEPYDKNVFTEETQFDLNQPLVIDLDAEYNFSLIKLRWEAACPSDYTVTAEDKNGNSRVILDVRGRAFRGGFNPVDRIIHTGTPTDQAILRAHAIGTTSLNAIKKITILPAAKDHGYTLRLFGIDLYGEKNSSTDAIEEINCNESAASQVIFDLQGRRVANPGHGLYIINGKKVLR